MLYDITEKGIGQPCEQCGKEIKFPAYKVEGMFFCTPACAFDYDKEHHCFSVPDVMIRASYAQQQPQYG